MKDEVLIIGCGEIGSSLIDGWLNSKKQAKKKIPRINVLEKNLKRRIVLNKKYGNQICILEINKLKKLKKKFKYIFLCFKPKDLNSNLKTYNDLFDHNSIFYSILAGKPLTEIKKYFFNSNILIRLMLNIPVSINSGTIIYYSLKNLNKNHLFLLNLLGKTYKLKNENFFDLVTTLVGSGPAYFYYLLEAMEKAANFYGLNKGTTKKILKETFLGSAKIIDFVDKDFKYFRESVTSKGGTTEAAIKSLEKKNFQKIIHNSIKDSVKKGKSFGSKKVK